MFGNWLHGVFKKDKVQIQVGVCALLWTIWNTRDDFVFNITKNPSFMKVIPRATHWIRMWSFLQPEEPRPAMDFGCSQLEMVYGIYSTNSAPDGGLLVHLLHPDQHRLM
jgi:hypothetical protein